MSLSQRYNSNAMPTEGEPRSRLLLQVFSLELRDKLCSKYGFKVCIVTDETLKKHGLLQSMSEVLVAPTMRAFYNVSLMDKVRVSRLIDIDLALHYPEEYTDEN